MQLISPRTPARQDSLPVLLVAVNLLLLSFFVMLNSLASAPTSVKEHHADTVLARVREGYDVRSSRALTAGALPQVPAAPWAQALQQKLQGVVLNRLQLPNVLAEVDATRLVIRLPHSRLFFQGQLRDTELPKALQLAAEGAQLDWQLQGEGPQVLAEAAALAAVTGQVSLRPGPPAVQVVMVPMPETTNQAGAGISAVVDQAGGEVQGQAP